jgi:hypothetical protein
MGGLVGPSNFFDTSDFQALSLFDSLNERRSLDETSVCTCVEPRQAAAEAFNDMTRQLRETLEAG